MMRLRRCTAGPGACANSARDRRCCCRTRPRGSRCSTGTQPRSPRRASISLAPDTPRFRLPAPGAAACARDYADHFAGVLQMHWRRGCRSSPGTHYRRRHGAGAGAVPSRSRPWPGCTQGAACTRPRSAPRSSSCQGRPPGSGPTACTSRGHFALVRHKYQWTSARFEGVQWSVLASAIAEDRQFKAHKALFAWGGAETALHAAGGAGAVHQPRRRPARPRAGPAWCPLFAVRSSSTGAPRHLIFDRRKVGRRRRRLRPRKRCVAPFSAERRATRRHAVASTLRREPAIILAGSPRSVRCTSISGIPMALSSRRSPREAAARQAPVPELRRVPRPQGAAHVLADTCIASRQLARPPGRCAATRSPSLPGWQFGGDGRCVRSPRSATTPLARRAPVDSYPAQENTAWCSPSSATCPR